MIPFTYYAETTPADYLAAPFVDSDFLVEPVTGPEVPPEVWQTAKPDPERCIHAIREMCR